MYYLTKAGVNFLNEASRNPSDDPRPYWTGPALRAGDHRRHQSPISGRIPSTQVHLDQRGRTYGTRSSDIPGHEKRMKDHMARVAARRKLNKKMGRDPNA